MSRLRIGKNEQQRLSGHGWSSVDMYELVSTGSMSNGLSTPKECAALQ
jgi:hypothetical protein